MEIVLEKGDIIICALQGDYGKPLPAVIIQSNLFNSFHASISVCPITSHIIDASFFRLTLYPDKSNGLQNESQIMIDKIVSISKEKIRQKIGKVNAEIQDQINTAIKLWLDVY